MTNYLNSYYGNPEPTKVWFYDGEEKTNISPYQLKRREDFLEFLKLYGVEHSEIQKLVPDRAFEELRESCEYINLVLSTFRLSCLEERRYFLDGEEHAQPTKSKNEFIDERKKFREKQTDIRNRDTKALIFGNRCRQEIIGIIDGQETAGGGLYFDEILEILKNKERIGEGEEINDFLKRLKQKYKGYEPT